MKTIRARLFAFAFITTLRQAAGLALARWIWIGVFVVLAILLLSQLWWVAAVWALLMFGLRIVYRRARRNGYATFEQVEKRPLDDVNILEPHKRVTVRATGMFSAGETEQHVLLRKAELWHIPLDEHAVMVERAPGSFLYQFVQPKFTEQVRAGYFLFGQDRLPGLEITFFTDWSPKLDYSGVAYYVGGGFAAVNRLKRTIYLAFDSEEDWLRVWKSFAERTDLTD